MSALLRVACLRALLVVLLGAMPAAAQVQLTRSVVASGAVQASGGAYAVRATVGQAAVGTVAGGSYRLCQGFWCTTASLPLGLQAAVVALLQGPYSGAGAMRTDLTLPTAQPYADPVYDGTPLDYDGTEANPSPPATAVDWVLVQLRTTPAAADAVQTVAAFLLADGTVVGASGTGAPTFAGVAPGAYYVVVKHRNHLAAMTATAVDLTTTAANFTTGAYGANGVAPLGGGLFGLWAGDGDGSGTVLAPDRQTVWLPQVGQAGYLRGDFDLDGSVLATDRQNLWQPNVGRQSQVPGAGALAPPDGTPAFSSDPPRE